MINDINNEKRKENMIKGLGVFELRAVARQLGVPSPTTKKRDELIELILEASRNGKYIEENIPKRGRPFKRLNVLEHITNKISPDDFKGLDFETVIRFAQDVAPCMDKIEDEIYYFEGVVRKYEYAKMFDLTTNEAVFLEDSVDYFDKVESGDYIKVEAQKLAGEENQFVTLQIKEINGQPAEVYQPNFIDLGKEIIDTAVIPFADGNVKLGRRNAYQLKEAIFEADYFDNLYKYCVEEGYHLITLGVNISFENHIKLNSLLSKDNFTTVYGTTPDISFNKIIDAILYAYNCADRGEDVVLFITDIFDIVRCLDLNFENDFDDDHAPKTKVVIQKLLAFAHSYQDGYHETVILCYDEGDLREKFLTDEILKICNKL